MNRNKFFKTLILFHLQKKILFTQRKADYFLLILILIFTICFGVFNGYFLHLLYINNKIEILKLVFIVLSCILFMFNGFFLGYKKIGIEVVRNCYPISNWDKIVLLFINENLTHKNIIFFAYLASTSIFSTYSFKSIQFIEFSITIIFINFLVRIFQAVKTIRLARFLLTTLVIIIGVNVTWYYYNLGGLWYTLLLVSILFFFRIYINKVDLNNSITVTKKKPLSAFNKASFPFFVHQNNIALLSFTFFSKIILFVLFVLVLHKFIIGYNLFLLLLLSPLLWFNYIFNNFIALNSALFVNLIQSGIENKIIIRKYFKLILQFILLDFIISSVLFTIVCFSSFGTFDLILFSKLKLISFYFETVLILVPIALLNSFYFFRNVSGGLFSKNSTSPLASLISVIITLFFSVQLYTTLSIAPLFFMVISFVGFFYLYHLAIHFFSKNKIGIMEKFSKK